MVAIMRSPKTFASLWKNWWYLLALATSSFVAAGSSKSMPSLPLNDVNIVFVSDVHSWVAGHNPDHEPYLNVDYGTVLSFFETLQHKAAVQKKDLFFVNNGDILHGTGLSIQPERLTPILERMPFSALNLGNHELYFDETLAMMRDKGFIDHWNGNYLTSNSVWTDSGSPIGSRFTYLQTEHGGRHKNILVFGFLYNFEGACSSATVQRVEDVVKQQWFIDVLQVNNRYRNHATNTGRRKKGGSGMSAAATLSSIDKATIASSQTSISNNTNNETEYVLPRTHLRTASTLSRFDAVIYEHYDAVVVLAHMGHDHPLIRVIQSAIRTITGNADLPIQVIAGDSHVRAFETLDAKSTVVQPGSFLDTIGFVSFPFPTRSTQGDDQAVTNSTAHATTAAMLVESETANSETAAEPDGFHHVFLDANKKVLQEVLAGNRTALETGRGRALTHFIQGTRLSMGLTNRIGCSGGRYRLDLPVDHPRSLWGLYVNEVVPHALGNNHSRVFVQDTMALKYDMLVGPITVDDAVAVSPVPDEMVLVVSGIAKKHLLLLFSKLDVTAPNSKKPNLPQYAISPWPHALYHPNSVDISGSNNKPHSLSSHHHHSYELYAMRRDWPVIAQALMEMADDESNTFSTWDYKEEPEVVLSHREQAHPQTSYGLWIDFIQENWMCVAPKTQLMIFTGTDLLIWFIVLTVLAAMVHYHSWINHHNVPSGTSYVRMGGVTVRRYKPEPSRVPNTANRISPSSSSGRPPPYGSVNYPTETSFLLGRQQELLAPEQKVQRSYGNYQAASE